MLTTSIRFTAVVVVRTAHISYGRTGEMTSRITAFTWHLELNATA